MVEALCSYYYDGAVQLYTGNEIIAVYCKKNPQFYSMAIKNSLI